MTDVHSRLASALSDRYRIERELGEGGKATVYPGPRAVISSGRGRESVWSTSGRDYLVGRGNRNFDVHPDGNHFLFLKTQAQQRLVVRLNALAPEPR